MTNTQAIKMIGHCQCCGRSQAVIQSTGRMSKHGYTVKYNWFQGVCDGQGHLPLEQDRKALDGVCLYLTDRAATNIATAAKLESGEQHLVTVRAGWDVAKREYKTVAWADAKPWEQRDATNAAVSNLRATARQMTEFVAFLQALAARVHGQALVEEKKAERPDPILIGEVRNGMTVTQIIGPRVYWRSEAGRKGWTGTGAWRKLPLAETTAA